MAHEESVHATRRRRLLVAGLGLGLVVAVGCASTSGSTGSPKPTPPTPGQFAPSSVAVPTVTSIKLPTYGPTSTTTRRNTIG